MAAARDIRSLPFRHPDKPGLGAELFMLSELYARADRRALDHALETPQRPEFHTLYLGFRGKGTLLVDFEPVALGANTLTFVARGRVQQFVPDRKVDAWMLLFAPELLVSSGDDADPLRLPTVLSPLWSSPSIRVPPAELVELYAVVELIRIEQARALDHVQPSLLAALVRTLVLRAERLVGAAPPPPAALQRFFTILERDHLQNRSVAHYAREAGVSPRRLAELLVAATGKSTKQIIDERVVLELKRDLVHSTLTVKELAHLYDFAEPTNLVKFFRRYASSTPERFRRERRNLSLRRRS